MTEEKLHSLEGKITTSEMFTLTSLPRRIISRHSIPPHICLANRKGEFIVALKHGSVSTNSSLPVSMDRLSGAIKVNCDSLDSVVKALDSKEISIKTTQARVRVFSQQTSVSIFQYPMTVDDIEIIKDGRAGLKMKMKDYVMINKFLPAKCDMIHFRDDQIAWADPNNIYTIERKIPHPFFMPREILRSMATAPSNPETYVYQSQLSDGDIVLRWGEDDEPKHAIRYKEHVGYKDTEFDRKLKGIDFSSIGWMKVPSLKSFKDLKIHNIKWTKDAILSHRSHNYNIAMHHHGKIIGEFITAVLNLPPGVNGTEMAIYDSDGIIMFKVGKWKLYASKKVD